jgi:hypothetical protein
MRIFHGPDWRLPRTDPTIAVAIYPQVIALTRLLSSPYWQAQVSHDNPPGQERFAREARRTADPLCQWILHWHPHALPAAWRNYRRWPDPPWAR